MSDVVACRRVTDGRGLPGSAKRSCARCGARVWLSPSSCRLVATGVIPVCTACAVRTTPASGAVLVAATDAEQRRQQLADEHGLPAADVAPRLPVALAVALDAATRSS